MRDLLVQFAELEGAPPRGWSRFDLWAGDRVLSDRYCNAWSYQGWIFEGYDRGVIWREGDVLLVAAFCDDLDDWAGERWGRLVRFPLLAPDLRFGGAINVNVAEQLFAEGASLDRLGVAGAVVRPFEDLAALVPFEVDVELVGIWLTDQAYVDHQTARIRPSWRQWTYGVDPALVDATGRVRPQRPEGLFDRPTGTRTYYLRSIALSTGTHAADLERAMIRDISGVGAQESVSVGTSSAEVFVFTSEASEPGVLSWPSGDYRVQLDIPAVGVDLAFGPLNIGGASGHFARVNSTPDTDVETKQPTQGPASGAGLHLFTFSGAFTAPGAVDDRFQVLVAAQRLTGHGNQQIFIRYSADCFADAPFAGGGAGSVQGVIAEAVGVVQLELVDVEISPAVISFGVEVV